MKLEQAYQFGKALINRGNLDRDDILAFVYAIEMNQHRSHYKALLHL